MIIQYTRLAYAHDMPQCRLDLYKHNTTLIPHLSLCFLFSSAREYVRAVQAALNATNASWSFVQYGGTVHAFTEPTMEIVDTNVPQARVSRSTWHFQSLCIHHGGHHGGQHDVVLLHHPLSAACLLCRLDAMMYWIVMYIKSQACQCHQC